MYLGAVPLDVSVPTKSALRHLGLREGYVGLYRGIPLLGVRLWGYDAARFERSLPGTKESSMACCLSLSLKSHERPGI